MRGREKVREVQSLVLALVLGETALADSFEKLHRTNCVTEGMI